jgi:hypothetical protein
VCADEVDRSGVLAVIGELVAAAVLQHVAVHEEEPGSLAGPGNWRGCPSWPHLNVVRWRRDGNVGRFEHPLTTAVSRIGGSCLRLIPVYVLVITVSLLMIMNENA